MLKDEPIFAQQLLACLLLGGGAGLCIAWLAAHRRTIASASQGVPAFTPAPDGGPTCALCTYALAGLAPTGLCPECGKPFDTGVEYHANARVVYRFDPRAFRAAVWCVPIMVLSPILGLLAAWGATAGVFHNTWSWAVAKMDIGVLPCITFVTINTLLFVFTRLVLFAGPVPRSASLTAAFLGFSEIAAGAVACARSGNPQDAYSHWQIQFTFWAAGITVLVLVVVGVVRRFRRHAADDPCSPQSP